MDRGGKTSEVRGVAPASRAVRWVIMGLIVLVGSAGAARAGDDPVLREYPSKCYTLHTDLPEPEAREALVRVNRVAEEYLGRTAAFSAGGVKGPMPFYLYKDVKDYLAAGGIEGSGGVFDGKRLMAVTLRRPDGVISLSTWHIVQHEGFHQFVRAAIGEGRDVVPIWADEGLAEYFGEGLFTGDGFEAGLIPQTRLIRLQGMLLAKDAAPLKRFMTMTREQWNDPIDMRNYDQAWSLVHFFAHAEGGRWRPAFEAYMRDVGAGGDATKAYEKLLAAIRDLEPRWRDWWINLPDHPTGDLYDRATLEILTSFLARSYAVGQRFESFDAFAKSKPEDLKQPEQQWLPPTLLGMGLAEAQKIRAMGGTFALVRSASGPPEIMMKGTDGTMAVGRFEMNEAGVASNVRVDVLAKGSPKRRPPPATTRTTGEMLR
jgi:hypothetical protein